MPWNLENRIPTRRSLLSRLKNPDDQESWNDFSRIYRGLVYGVAIQAGLTDSEAQDVVQETFMSVVKTIKEFNYDPAIGSFKSWLRHTTKWKIADRLRKKVKEAAVGGRHTRATARTSTVDRIPDPAGFRLEEIWDAEWEKCVLNAALEKVKPQVKARQYQLFDLYTIKGWPVQKVAHTLDVNVGQVYLAKHRISALLRKEIKSLENRLL
jgi:RNA polymerase sigma factor (sigma-70 family)